jgi:hypothetical protein
VNSFKNTVEGKDMAEFGVSLYFVLPNRSRCSSVRIANGCGLGVRGVGDPIGSTIFISPCRPYRLWDPPNLLSNGYRGKAAGALS